MSDAAVPRALKFAVSDVDPDYVRLDITAADGYFAGFTEVYGGMDLIADVASRLDGFPSYPNDRREILLGSQDARALSFATLLIIAITVLATTIPAARAARVSPTNALQSD